MKNEYEQKLEQQTIDALQKFFEQIQEISSTEAGLVLYEYLRSFSRMHGYDYSEETFQSKVRSAFSDGRDIDTMKWYGI